MSEYPLHHLSLEEIARRCREEAGRARADESGYCFELFRRALEMQDEIAWRAIHEQYRGLLLSWLSAAAAKQFTTEEVEDLLQMTLEKFWRTLSNRSADFNHVGAFLSYLRQCALTATLDARRQAKKRENLRQALAASLTVESASLLDRGTLEQLYQMEQLQRVREWVGREVDDPLEKLVLQLSFEQGLKPAEIAARYPNHFATVQEVRQIKERVLKRARRALLD